MTSPEPAWPRFRGNKLQNGQWRAQPKIGITWSHAPASQSSQPGNAARGIFNSAVIDNAGLVWSGTAHARLWVIQANGSLLHDYELGALVDTTPLLDPPTSSLYISCADGWIWRASPPDSKPTQWFQAAKPTDAFINWFEGHLGQDSQGRIVAPCDNHRVYIIKPDRAQKNSTNADLTPLELCQSKAAKTQQLQFWDFPMQDQTWSLACCTPDEWLFFGNNAMRTLGQSAGRSSPNLFGIDSQLRTQWRFETGGSVVASPLWSTHAEQRWLYAGSFDGTLYAFDFSALRETALGPQGLPKQATWTFTTRDHLYASPAQLSDGTIIQAGVDGSIYALEPLTGQLLWQHDLDGLNPVRSSPAIDGQDHIYVGTGDGRLLVLNKQGLRVADVALVPYEHGPRKAINASPALGPHGVVVGDSEGWLHQIGWQQLKSHTKIPSNAWPERSGIFARLLHTDCWGVNRATSSLTIFPGQTLCFSLECVCLYARDTSAQAILGLIEHVDVIEPNLQRRWEVRLSGDRRYVLLRMLNDVRAGENFELNLCVQWLKDPQRKGLRMQGGHRESAFTQHWSVHAEGASAPKQPPTTIWLQRMALSLPTLMPSYNQIGFETLVYSMGHVTTLPDGRHLYWLIGCTQAGLSDVQTRCRFPLTAQYNAQTGGLNLEAHNVVSELNGFRTEMQWFAIACHISAQGEPLSSPSIRIRYLPSGVQFYGAFLEGLGIGNATQPVEVLGSADLLSAKALSSPTVSNVINYVLHDTSGLIDAITVTFNHNDLPLMRETCLSILLQDTRTGDPVQTDYAYSLQSPNLLIDFGSLILHKPPGVQWPAQEYLHIWLMLGTTAHLSVNAKLPPN